MTLNLIFWVLMLIWLVTGVGYSMKSGAKGDWLTVGGNAFTFILFAVLGWSVFGAPIK